MTKRFQFILKLLFKGKRKYFTTLLLMFIGGFYLVNGIYPTYHPSTFLFADNGKLLSSQVNNNGQWRFTKEDSIPSKYETCLLYYEDEWYYEHFAVNPMSIARATISNIQAGEIKSGGSTITMQLARILNGNKKRTFINKIKELYIALSYEFKYSKKEILNAYATHAPYGSNVIGLTGASWRFYNRSPQQLSWAESATLAVLPNAPGLIYPGRGNDQLKKKRDFVLRKLLNNGVIDSTTYTLSKLEPVPQGPNKTKQQAYHYMRWLSHTHPQYSTHTSTLKQQLQQQLNQLVNGYHAQYVNNGVNNIAVVILNTETNSFEGYVGNSGWGKSAASFVDVARANRSSGSVLKPLLYAKCIEEGALSPFSLVNDLPINYDGFSPKNFAKTYSGLASLNQALIQSLNAPAVAVLKTYGLNKFYQNLKDLGFSTLNQQPSHYGLSLILGGAEIKLVDLVGAYGYLLKMSKNPSLHSVKWRQSKRGYWQHQFATKKYTDPQSWKKISEILTNLKRPHQEWGWEWMEQKEAISWKTGTSFGHRDAWAIGYNGKHVVGVWVGNQAGNGRPGLTGVNYAAPILFKAFKLLPQKSSSTYETQIINQPQITLCAESGYRATMNCLNTIPYYNNENTSLLKKCNFHKRLLVDETGQYQVGRNCYYKAIRKSKPYFIPTPFQSYYFKKVATFYETPPPFHPQCAQNNAQFKLTYPSPNSSIFLPVDIEEKQQPIILEAVSAINDTLYWHLNKKFIGTTIGKHSFTIHPKTGKQQLTLVNSNGASEAYSFTIIKR